MSDKREELMESNRLLDDCAKKLYAAEICIAELVAEKDQLIELLYGLHGTVGWTKKWQERWPTISTKVKKALRLKERE